MPAFDLNTLSDDDAEELSKMLTPGAPAPVTTPAPAVALPKGAIDINALSDDDATLIVSPMGGGEAAARLLGHHLSFGLADNLIGRKELAQASREHPFIDLGTGAASMIAQTAALGPLAAGAKGLQIAANAPRIAQAGQALAKGAGKVAETMLPNLGAKTAYEAGRTGSKIGAAYSGATTLGSELTDPNKTTGEALGDTAISTGVGALAGGLLGAGVHGGSRFAGALANRLLPNLREVSRAAAAPEAQGIREVWRNAGYDDVDFDKLAAELAIRPPPGATQQQADEVSRLLAQGVSEADIAAQTGLASHAVTDIASQEAAIANRFADLNVVEALKMGKLKAQPVTGELKPEVVTTQNLNKLQQDSANTPGRGQNEAAEALRCHRLR